MGKKKKNENLMLTAIRFHFTQNHRIRFSSGVEFCSNQIQKIFQEGGGGKSNAVSAVQNKVGRGQAHFILLLKTN